MHRTDGRAGVGTLAPDFQLADGRGREVRLSDLRGQTVVLAFYPGAWDPSRADQLAQFNALVAQVPGSTAELLGISREGLWCELAFADDAVRVPMLADLDPHGTVAEQFGVDGEQAIVVVGDDGRRMFTTTSVPFLTAMPLRPSALLLTQLLTALLRSTSGSPLRSVP